MCYPKQWLALNDARNSSPIKGKILNKNELINAVAQSTGVDRKTADAVVDSVFSTIVRTVNKGDSVTVTGFGVFEKRHRARRVARNPRTGDVVKVKATNVPAFRPSAHFKDVVAKRTKVERTGSVIKRADRADAVKAAPVKAPAKVAVRKAAPAKAAPTKKAAPVKAAPKKVAVKAAPKKAAPAKKATPKKAVAK